ncbi:calcium uniporter protein 4, mitochondrial-like [Phalaenopsis equestris]|uniref:calcium uniporter protein 4, mitochondrial-like n=1 Tax=Phalaenopsis equestris TaxID=78828 RepID=UPI0009E51249|nr:calcium uniporter protein 4, mitochondrial-like [Phalaenopsis equestris]
MAFGKTLARRFLDMASTSPIKIRGNAGAVGIHSSLIPRRIPPQSGGRRLRIQAAVTKELKWGFRAAGVMHPFMPRRQSVVVEEEELLRKGASIEELRKAIMASQVEMVRLRLKGIAKSVIEFSEFLRICCECSSEEQGMGLARSLDMRGMVMVHGKVVFLHPDQITKAIQNVITQSLLPPSETKSNELRQLEEKKAMIDKEAEYKVRRELWSGLGFLAAQTMAFMRLTFWELSWDVMEPICFYVTSLYFMAGFIFFMRTSTDPSFESFFNSRFATKQKQLMKEHSFDISRYNELRSVISPPC